MTDGETCSSCSGAEGKPATGDSRSSANPGLTSTVKASNNVIMVKPMETTLRHRVSQEVVSGFRSVVTDIRAGREKVVGRLAESSTQVARVRERENGRALSGPHMLQGSVLAGGPLSGLTMAEIGIASEFGAFAIPPKIKEPGPLPPPVQDPLPPEEEKKLHPEGSPPDIKDGAWVPDEWGDRFLGELPPIPGANLKRKLGCGKTYFFWMRLRTDALYAKTIAIGPLEAEPQLDAPDQANLISGLVATITNGKGYSQFLADLTKAFEDDNAFPDLDYDKLVEEAKERAKDLCEDPKRCYPEVRIVQKTALAHAIPVEDHPVYGTAAGNKNFTLETEESTNSKTNKKEYFLKFTMRWVVECDWTVGLAIRCTLVLKEGDF